MLKVVHTIFIYIVGFKQKSSFFKKQIVNSNWEGDELILYSKSPNLLVIYRDDFDRLECIREYTKVFNLVVTFTKTPSVNLFLVAISTYVRTASSSQLSLSLSTNKTNTIYWTNGQMGGQLFPYYVLGDQNKSTKPTVTSTAVSPYLIFLTITQPNKPRKIMWQGSLSLSLSLINTHIYLLKSLTSRTSSPTEMAIP